MRKGISPLIATILMIAFVMAIATLFAQWYPSLMDNAMEGQRDTAQELNECSQLRYTIATVREDTGAAVLKQEQGDQPVGVVQTTYYLTNGNIDQYRVNITGVRGIKAVSNDPDWSGVDPTLIDKIGTQALTCQGVPAISWTAPDGFGE